MAGPVHYHEGAFPPEDLDWRSLISLIGSANAAVARYDGLLSAIPNASVLLSPLTTQEAVLSSRIEGTQATMGEVLQYEARGDDRDPTSPKEADIWEVLNYRKAMRAAEAMLVDLPLSQRLVKEAHRILLSGVRGHGKSPGEYRKIPNWIGPHGCSIDEARFVPVAADRLPDAMSRWERYVHEETPDRLLQLAILHAEFEAIHPFLDGNGRLGRMLIPLFLFQAGLIQTPMFYISAYLESHRETYYERLLAVSREQAWTQWCVFFLEAVQQQAHENLTKATAILDLYNAMKTQFVDMTRSQYAIHALDWVFERPIFKSSDFVRASQIPEATAKRILGVLKQEGILRVIEEGAGQRPAVLAYPALLNIAEGYEAF
ncbi:Fic family protein [Allochromatium vinosum]|uniref:Fic family protein n=1 Tax=Allochromatium vinosum TaxID=1049 RepID=UPI0019058A8F|nr:Fic/DOC family N-terminal domain-containing protein [Allochromatium vinosum]MBK1654916.1 cell filamentation protein Fic [Allochromatium vinosum]